MQCRHVVAKSVGFADPPKLTAIKRIKANFG